jgi:hypothetical protein
MRPTQDPWVRGYAVVDKEAAGHVPLVAARGGGLERFNQHHVPAAGAGAHEFKQHEMTGPAD